MSNQPVQYHEGDFPPKRIEWERLILLIGPANAALARYDGTLAAMSNSALLLSPLMTQEAVLSSRIEGTQATMAEVLEFEAGLIAETLDEHHTGDIHEVLNYRKAMWRAVELLKELPLCQRLIKEAHEVLMQGVRGKKQIARGVPQGSELDRPARNADRAGSIHPCIRRKAAFGRVAMGAIHTHEGSRQASAAGTASR